MAVAERFYQYRDHFEVIYSIFRMMDFTAWLHVRVKCESEWNSVIILLLRRF